MDLGMTVTLFSQVTVRRMNVDMAPELIGPSVLSYTVLGTSAPVPFSQDRTTLSPGFVLVTPSPEATTVPEPS
jgi:hypothetical protein